jgi:hypothetical protein
MRRSFDGLAMITRENMGQDPLNNLIDLYEAWNKPEKANQWRAKQAQTEDFEE